MIYKAEWTFLAESSYFEEIEFVYLKWNLKEVLKFENLVSIEIKRIELNPTIGRYKEGKYSLVISKQTTMFYRINENSKSLELLLFWNNSKNPDDLVRLL